MQESSTARLPGRITQAGETRRWSNVPLVDSMGALALTGVVVASLIDYRFLRYHTPPPVNAVGVGADLLQTLPLVWRRRRPLLVLLIVWSATMTPPLLGHFRLPLGQAAGILSALACIYTVAAYGDRKRSLVGGVVGLTGFLLLYSADVQDRFDLAPLVGLTSVVGVWFLGDRMRLGRQYTAGLDREARTRQALAGERGRIARELHDVIAHSVSVMGIQAGAARMSFEANPRGAWEAIASIESTSRQAVDEMHRLLGLLRSEEGLSLVPQPGLDGLEALIREAREAGLEVELTLEDPPQPLPAALDLSAYRIVQEALTNVRKHAGPTRTKVCIRYPAHGLEIEVVDEGSRSPSRPTTHSGSGYGLMGMHERVALFGGELQVGPVPGGGFAVKARLPRETDGR
ncbi:MAG: sensor histidine kinase [Actinomycetota bacterium]